MAFPSASDAPTTSPSHGNTSCSVHGESPRPIPEKCYFLYHPRLHLPTTVESHQTLTEVDTDRRHTVQ